MPDICREYALQLEFKGSFAEALEAYQRGHESIQGNTHHLPNDCQATALKAVTELKQRGQLNDEKELETIFVQGLCRMSLRNGNVARGMKMLSQIQDKKFFKECAAILEELKQFQEAASLYVQTESYEKAVG